MFKNSYKLSWWSWLHFLDNDSGDNEEDNNTNDNTDDKTSSHTHALDGGRDSGSWVIHFGSASWLWNANLKGNVLTQSSGGHSGALGGLGSASNIDGRAIRVAFAGSWYVLGKDQGKDQGNDKEKSHFIFKLINNWK